MNKNISFGVIALAMCLIMCCTCLISCNSAKKRFIGVWEVNKVVSDSDEITFGEIIPGIVLEMSIQFYNDNTYITHYYVNGKESENYPKTGTFTIEGDTLVLSDGRIASISGDGLIIRNTKDGSYWYCTGKDSIETTTRKPLSTTASGTAY